MKKFIGFTALLAAIGLFGTACEKTPTPEGKKLDITFSLDEATHNSIAVIAKPGKDVETFRYAIAHEADRKAFENGTLEGIKEQAAAETSVLFSGLQAETEYTIFMQGMSGDDKGNTFSRNISTVKDLDNLDLKVTPTLNVASETVLSFHLEFGADCKGYTCALVKKSEADQAAFENGTLSGIKTVDKLTVNQTFDKLTKNTDYVFYVRGKADDKVGETFVLDTRTLLLNLTITEIERGIGEDGLGYVKVQIDTEGDTAKYKYCLDVPEMKDYFLNGLLPTVDWRNVEFEEDGTTPKPYVMTASGLTLGKEWCIFISPFSANNAEGDLVMYKIKIEE